MTESNYVVEENQRPKSEKQTMEKNKREGRERRGRRQEKLVQVMRMVKGSIKQL